MSEDESRELPRLADNPDTKVVLYKGGYGIDHDVMTLVKAAELLRDEASIGSIVLVTMAATSSVVRIMRDARG